MILIWYDYSINIEFWLFFLVISYIKNTYKKYKKRDKDKDFSIDALIYNALNSN